MEKKVIEEVKRVRLSQNSEYQKLLLKKKIAEDKIIWIEERLKEIEEF